MGKTQRMIGGMLILLALGLAAYAWVLSNRMTAEQQKAKTEMQSVVVAMVRITAGTVITPEMVRLSSFPTRPEGAYTDTKAVLGKATASDIAPGEPLLLERLEGNARAMLQHLEAGERAVAIRVDDVIAVGNRLNPGDRVDAYVTLRRNSEEISDSQSRLLLEKLRVLAFGSKDAVVAKDGAASMRATPETPKTVVLAVKIPDVEKLALAADSGRLLLALRPQEPSPESLSSVNAASSMLAMKGVSQPAALTLRDLVGAPKTVERGLRIPLNSPVKPSGAAATTGTSVSVMHGLKEKTVYLSKKQAEAQR